MKRHNHIVENIASNLNYLHIWILLSGMESKQDYPPPSGQYPNPPGYQQQGNDQMCAAPLAYPSTAQYQPVTNQPGYQQQGKDQMYAAPAAYPSSAQYQPVPAYSTPLQYQPGLVMVQLNFLSMFT